MGFKLPPILKQVTTTCVGISDRTRECRTWVLPACANPGNNRDRSLLLPSPQKEQVIGYLLWKTCLEGKLNGNVKVSTSLPRQVNSVTTAAFPSLPASPGLRVGKFQWNTAAVESPAHGRETWPLSESDPILQAALSQGGARELNFVCKKEVMLVAACVAKQMSCCIFMSADSFVGCVTSFLDMMPSIY